MNIFQAQNEGEPQRMSRLPEQLTMSPSQALTLRTLAFEAYQERMFEPCLTHEEAERRIEELKKEIALADSF
ncbi:MAG: hypothetical protein BGN91_04500 [Nitrobacter sp. 62-13]|nr:MAG: hypothetical protein BGN91_04500 [Nitrobacter sp. 62-13]